MSHLHAGDEDMHYPGGEHRWLAPTRHPTDAEEAAWRARVQAHKDEHRRQMDGHPFSNGSGRRGS